MKDMETILIADDNEINREILADMMYEDFRILEAENGKEALAMINDPNQNIDLLLLDVVMPEMDGFEVLDEMNRSGRISTLPVIMISAETSPKFIGRAYDLGAADYITRPFDAVIVHKRVMNTILLYAKQKKLVNLVQEQIYEREKNNHIMISIMSHIVEFRNGESGLHVLHINTMTEILMREWGRRFEEKPFSETYISTVSMASSLHDIGKIVIPESILNKPGRLTDEEYEVMKTHSAAGAKMLEDLDFYGDNEFIKYAHAIARWHHERWDGRGYPDGLKGDEIPLCAQIVSMCDVYDALSSERVYKPPFPHDKAIGMIVGGECGAFNPKLIECLLACADEIRAALKIDALDAVIDQRIKNVAKEMIEKVSGLESS